MAANQKMRRWLAALATIALALAAEPGIPADLTAADARLSGLMQQLARREHGKAAFVERQYLAVLDRPLQSSGELLYDAPDRLEKRTLLPKPESLVLQNGAVTITRGGRQYRFALRDHPQVLPFVESVRATLAGDLPALEKDFDLHFESADGAWTLDLAPRDAKLSGIIKRIRIGGSGTSIQRVEITRTDGDRSVMTISPLPPVDPSAPVSPSAPVTPSAPD